MMSHRESVLDFQPISAERLWRLTAPLRAYHRPRFFGLEYVDPERPSLPVGNRTIYGLLTIPPFVRGLGFTMLLRPENAGCSAHF